MAAYILYNYLDNIICILYAHPLCGALPVAFLSVLVAPGAFVAHRFRFRVSLLQNLAVPQDFYTYLSISMERQRQLSMERRRQLSMERQCQLSMERRRQLSMERQRQLCTERRRQLSMERQRQLSMERLSYVELA